MVGFFLNMVIYVYVMHECIHIHYLNKEKFTQINMIAQKLSKMTKKVPKMLIQGLGGTLYAYFMVVKPPSLFSSQKMGIVRELVHSIL